MLREAGHPASHAALASRRAVGPAGLLSKVAEAVTRTALSSRRPGARTPRAGRLRLERAAKRALDLCVAATALILLLPLLLLIGLLVWAGDRGAPIFRHARVGRDGRAFGCLKFRTMVADGDGLLQAHLAADPAARAEWDATHKLRDDPRVTPLGRVLRRTSLDELPQLWNVLRGEMSLVGPRPIVRAEVARYGAAFATCFSMPPGLTGLWQISGRSGRSYAERVRLDLDYATRWRLGRDLAILARTVPAVLAQRGSR
jgi:exopolysaccharide production protein ExoY